ncbi:MAG: hypothetical protein K6G52_01020 [Treponemataceae bacterium]|nr:hypothetical protein [Treponemataceae bacterium]
MKKSNIILLSLTILLSITLITGLATRNTDTNRKMIKSALLNPKYAEKIEKIVIDGESFETELQKSRQNDTSNRMSYLMSYFNSKNYDIKYDNISGQNLKCDKNMTSEFIENMTNVIILAKIDRKSAKNVQIDYKNHIQLFGDGDRKILDLSFSKSDSTGTRIFIKNNLTDKVYSAQDNYSKYFEMEWKDFLNKNFFPENLESSAKSIQTILIQDKNRSFRTLQKSASGLEGYLNHIFSMQSNQIVLVENWDYVMQEINLEKVITFEDGQLNQYTVKLYITDGQYFVYAQGILYKVSEWTYAKLAEI